MSSSQNDILVDTKTYDYLEEDPEIRGQKYVCLSFISPEEVIRDKHVYYFKEFLSFLGSDIMQLLNNLSIKFSEDEHVLDMIKGLLDRYDYLGGSPDAIYEQFESFKKQNSDALEQKYNEANKFQTSIRGIKVRGCYESLPEAQNRAKKIQQFDKNFNVYVAQVGCWCPWDPNPDNLDSEFADTQLNTLMKSYMENQAVKSANFEERKNKLMDKVKIVEEVDEPAASSSVKGDLSEGISASEALESMKKYM
jgi:hypothetical protein